MPRLYNQMYSPFTYQDFVAPLQDSTEAHKQVEKDYVDSKMVVDSLRQRAMNEPDAKWSQRMLEYADNLDKYAYDLMKNGLTADTNMNLMNMKSGFGTTINPILAAIAREKELQTVRDNQIGNGIEFTNMPSLDQLIDNPNLGQRAYNSNDLYKKAHDLAERMSERNINIISPRNYNKVAGLYEYGKQIGFSPEDIDEIMADDPEFNKFFKSVVDQSGYAYDNDLSSEAKNRLSNSIILGALSGFKQDIDMHYGNRPSYLNPLQQIEKQIKQKQLDDLNNPQQPDYNQYHNVYFTKDKNYRRINDNIYKLFDEYGKLKQEFIPRTVKDVNGNDVNVDMSRIYKQLSNYVAYQKGYDEAKKAGDYEAMGRTVPEPKPRGLEKVSKQDLFDLWDTISSYKDIVDAVNDLNLEDGLSNEIFSSKNNLQSYLNSLAANKYTTKINVENKDIIRDPIVEYANKHDDYAREIISIGDDLTKGHYQKDRHIKLSDLKPEDVLGLEYLLADHDKVYLNVKGQNDMLSIPITFFEKEIQDIVNAGYALYEQDKREIENMQSIDNAQKRENITKLQMLYQDSIARNIEQYLKSRENETFTKTINRNKVS